MLHHSRPTCPHCDGSYDQVKHIRERYIAVEKDKKMRIFHEIEKYCSHCCTKWTHDYDSTTFDGNWTQCMKDCDCGFTETHKEDCASREPT